jgi:hypothetical protein
MKKIDIAFRFAAFSVLVIVVYFLSIGLYDGYWRYQNKVHLDSQAKIILETPNKKHKVLDIYNNQCEVYVNIDKAQNMVTIKSGGKDQLLNTPDDVSVFRRDINKSMLFGKIIGQKSKQFVSGFKEGLSEKSKHED